MSQEPVIKRNYVAWIGACLFLIAIGLSIGIGIGARIFKSNMAGQTNQEVRLGGYRFISPLVDYSELKELSSKETKRLEKEIRRLIKERTSDGSILYCSVYFRDLLNGPWLSINRETRYVPASLLKVPLMIAYLKHAETHPDILQRTLTFHRNEAAAPVDQLFKPGQTLEEGADYTIDELLRRTIVFSDNEAKRMLTSYIDSINAEYRNQVYSDIGVSLHVQGTDSWLTAREYATFFRILFNASYLNKEMSEKALELLSQCDFKQGLVAGVPEGVVIAHKFGERGNATNGMQQLHDCGIVYYKDRPYLINIMTEGRDAGTLAEIIKQISFEVYSSMDKYHKAQ